LFDTFKPFFYNSNTFVRKQDKEMRIKLTGEQLTKLASGLPFEVLLEKPNDVRGLLELPGNQMPCDETGLSKFGDNALRRPGRVTFAFEETEGGFICDIHPALVQHIYTLLS
jgi:hypothetical protein